MSALRSIRPGARAAALLVCAALAACGGSGEEAGPAEQGTQEPDAHAIPFGDARTIVTRDGQYQLTWSPVGGSIPINEGFEVEVLVTRNDEAKTPVTGAEVAMTCFMPDHGHGMLREPRSHEIGDGRYLVQGFLLHMDGFWTVSATVVVDGLAATADDELNL